VPIESLVAMVEKRQPEVVALSVTISPNLPRLRAAIEAIRRTSTTKQPYIIVGGRALGGDPELAVRLGADVTANDAGQAVELLRERFSHASR
jgi:methanogenic corrinoid protein MtbC1